jgi:hypothetical protein
MYTGGQRMKIYFLLLVASSQEILETVMSGRALGRWGGGGGAQHARLFWVPLTNFKECFGPRGNKGPDILVQRNQYFRNSLSNTVYE